MKLSVVTTMYQSAGFLEEFHRRASAAASKLAEEFELVLVNDGSPDDSLERALAIAAKDERVKVVDLSRNFGHHAAIMAGLEAASGERVFLIDCDLEESPEWLLDFAGALDAKPRADVVYGVQARRKGGALERVSGGAFWKIFNLASGLRLVENAITVRLMTRRYVDALLEYRETEIFLAGLLHLAGFVQEPFLCEKGSRKGTSYTLRRKVALLVQSITSFSAAPLVLIFYAGAFMALVAFGFTVFLVVEKLVQPAAISLGWTSVMASIWLLSGVMMMSTGVLGIYLSRIFLEVKRRPRTVVRQIHQREVHGGPRVAG